MNGRPNVRVTPSAWGDPFAWSFQTNGVSNVSTVPDTQMTGSTTIIVNTTASSESEIDLELTKLMLKLKKPPVTDGRRPQPRAPKQSKAKGPPPWGTSVRAFAGR